MWTKHKRCGVRLTSEVSVGDWLAPADNSHQDRVDDAVRLVKAGGPASLGQITQLPACSSIRQIASDLRSAILLIEKLGDELARDDATVTRHGASLQLIDIALQTVRKAADLLTSSEAGQTSQI